jgi:predicted RNA binding protein YcfA (HicA-like mRNA interferase family)
MPKPKIISGREVCAILSLHGFKKIRQHGSHIVMQKKSDELTKTVPVPDHDVVSFGTLRSIIRQSGLNGIK